MCVSLANDFASLHSPVALLVAFTFSTPLHNSLTFAVLSQHIFRIVNWNSSVLYIYEFQRLFYCLPTFSCGFISFMFLLVQSSTDNKLSMLVVTFMGPAHSVRAPLHGRNLFWLSSLRLFNTNSFSPFNLIFLCGKQIWRLENIWLVVSYLSISCETFLKLFQMFRTWSKNRGRFTTIFQPLRIFKIRRWVEER